MATLKLSNLKKHFLGLVLGILILSPPTFAGNEVGDGGEWVSSVFISIGYEIVQYLKEFDSSRSCTSYSAHCLPLSSY